MKNSITCNARNILFVALILALGTACKKEKGDKNPSGDIVGTWELTAFTYDGDFLAFDEVIPVTITARNINNLRVTFHSNGTVTGNGTFTSVITSKADPSQVLEIPSGMFEDGGAWERAGNTLYVTDLISAERTGIPIAELNATTLRLSGNAVAEGGTSTLGTIDVRFTRRN